MARRGYWKGFLIGVLSPIAAFYLVFGIGFGLLAYGEAMRERERQAAARPAADLIVETPAPSPTPEVASYVEPPEIVSTPVAGTSYATEILRPRPTPRPHTDQAAYVMRDGSLVAGRVKMSGAKYVNVECHDGVVRVVDRARIVLAHEDVTAEFVSKMVADDAKRR